MEDTNLAITGQVRHMAFLRHERGDPLIVVARNDDTLQVLRVER